MLEIQKNKLGIIESSAESKGRAISCMSLSPDKQTLATVSMNNIITFYSLQESNKYYCVKGYELGTFENRCCFSPDGDYLATGSKTGAMNIISTKERNYSLLLSHSGPCTSVDWDKSYDYIVSSSNDLTIQLWEADYESK